MAQRPKLGAMFSPTASVTALPGFAERVDALGYEQLWLAEDCFAHGGISAAAVALTRMRRAAVGIGLLPVGLRKPALAAMELATLAHLYPGRVHAAFGHGVEPWMRQVDARPRDRIAYLRAVAGAVSRLTAGETVTRGTDPSLDRVRLDDPPPQPPHWLIGATGPRALAVAAELGFGFLLPEGAGTAAIRWASEAIGPHASTTVYCFLSLADERAVAERALLPVIRDWRARGLYPRLYELAGLPEADRITEADLGGVAVVGSPEACAQRLARLAEAGADTIVLQPVGDDPLETLARVQTDVVPLLHG